MKKKVLQGTGSLHFGTGRDFPAIAVLQEAASFMGINVVYAWLMGMSGAAFRAAWHVGSEKLGNLGKFCLSSGSVAPEDVLEAACRAIGLRLTVYSGKTLSDTWNAITRSISEEKPVLSAGLVGPPDHCLITGFEESGKRRKIYVRSFFDQSEEYTQVEFKAWQLPWGKNWIATLEKSEKPDEKELIGQSLARAIRFAKTEEMEHQTRWKTGLAAYEAWAQALEGEIADVMAPFSAMVNAWQTCSLMDARRAAAEYLRLLPAGWDIGHTDEHYEREVGILAGIMGILPFRWEIGIEEAQRQAAAHFMDTYKRKQAAALIRQALQDEKWAVEHIEMILSPKKEKLTVL